MDYDLTRLGAYEFEHLTQALCMAALGARTSIFGNGPDGGREATVDGPITWGSETGGDTWEGYTVVQAKFRMRPEDVASNLAWLLSELRKELSRWVDRRYKRSKTRKPDNLLIVTNVALSAAVGGGIDSVNREIDQLIESQSLQLAKWRLWHYDDLCALLDAHRSVRITYGGFITTGDVLSRMDSWLGRQTVDMGAALTGHVVKDLLAQQWIRLGESGDPADERLSLGSVVVDLPARAASRLRSTGRPEEAPAQVRAAEYIIDRGERVGDHGLNMRSARHLLVVGGPGQGKSTLTQLICQAYRVSLLRESACLSHQASRLRDHLEESFASIGLPIPKYLRWPIRIDLSAYSDVLAGDPELSLLRYIAGRIRSASPYDITASDLATWLSQWPWLLVLDGLDEVASPHMRESVTAAVSAFLVDAAAVDADVLVIVTTRPQGYAGEFGSEEYERLDLLALDERASVAYAGRLTAARFPDDEDARQKLQTRLSEAVSNDDSSRLMTTPLQITIMALLLERRQRAPHDRYQLFNAYFDTIYSREMNKATPIARLLEEHRSDVEAIHEMVALDLQRRAENERAKDVSISASELRAHALNRLEQEGYDSDQASSLANRLVSAATHRLVLLVPRRVDEVNFEVRSLQEYMAARALTNGESDSVLEQLRMLVASAHWRNTWLFSAGRIFREREKLRSPLITMMVAMDNDGLLPWLAAPGAELATDLIADDLAIRSPQYRRMLADHAMKRLSGLPDSTSMQLAGALQRVAEEDQLIRKKLDQQVDASLAAGGGARAHVKLVLNEWARSTGSLAARARQLQHKHGRINHPESLQTILITRAGISNSKAPKEPHRFSDYIGTFIPELNGDDRRAMRRLISQFKTATVVQVSVRDGRSDRGVGSRGYFGLPNMDVLQAAFSRPAVADAFAEAVHRIANEEWQIAAVLRDVARYWYARRPATAEGTSL